MMGKVRVSIIILQCCIRLADVLCTLVFSRNLCCIVAIVWHPLRAELDEKLDRFTKSFICTLLTKLCLAVALHITEWVEQRSIQKSEVNFHPRLY